MTEHTVLIRCEEGHTQTIRILGASREWAEHWCGLMDGSSPAYLSDPRTDPHSTIGKCGVCGRQITATLQEAGSGPLQGAGA